ncbi:hypothetical protein U1Q18_006090 [Sarracenia purpurea var. burkii]
MGRDETMPKSPQKIAMQFSRWLSDLDWRFVLLVLPPLSLLLFLALSAISTTSVTALRSFPSLAPLKSLFYNRTTPSPSAPLISRPMITAGDASESERNRWVRDWKTELNRSKMAVCLVGGARRFELTGPSIVENILEVYPNSDLFVHSPFDSNAFKFSLLKIAPRIASVRIFNPNPLPETESAARVLTASNSPNGIQGLLQYFHLVEGCLTMIKSYQDQNNFTYDWIVRTRVDGYWSAPLMPDCFVPGKYVVPRGSSFGGLNDRLGIGDLNTSVVALSRLTLIPQLDSAGFRQLNSESAFRAQLTTQGVDYVAKRVPFCVVSDRKYEFPPGRYDVPVAALSSPGPLSGAKCRPCTVACDGLCVGSVMVGLNTWWSWTDWANGSLRLCDARREWQMGWERLFDRTAGTKLATARKRVWELKMEQCVDDFELMKRRTANWDTPPPVEICRHGLGSG